MKFQEIPLTWLGCVFIALAMIMTYFDLNGFAHTILGMVVGYFFHKATRYDETKQNTVAFDLKNSTVTPK